MLWSSKQSSISVQFSTVTQSCLTLCNPMDCRRPGLPVHHQLLELAQTHVHQVSDAMQPSNPLSSPSPPVFSLSQHQGLFQWVNSLHQAAKVLELQLHQSSNEYSGLISFRMTGLISLQSKGLSKRESSPIPHFKSISSSVLSFLYGPTLTSILVFTS